MTAPGTDQEIRPDGGGVLPRDGCRDENGGSADRMSRSDKGFETTPDEETNPSRLFFAIGRSYGYRKKGNRENASDGLCRPCREVQSISLAGPNGIR